MCPARRSAPSPHPVFRCLCVFLLALTVLPPGPALADSADGEESATRAADGSEAPEDAGPKVFLETLTVTAKRAEGTLADTPGAVGVIEASEIYHLGLQDARDLTKYEPGIYVEGDPTRLGLSGFNIRGVGGNRVQTRIDGIPTAEQFDFGPFSVTRYSLDLDEVERVEIVRSAGSSLYGSDALGGVVSFETRDPASYLGEIGGDHYVSLRGGGSSRNDEVYFTAVYATQGEAWRASIQGTRRGGSELDNQGTVDTEDRTRTRPNPIDRDSLSFLGKLVFDTSTSSTFKVTAGWLRGDTDTQVLSSQGPSAFGASVLGFDATDEQRRFRVSLEQNLQSSGGGIFDTLLWSIYGQRNETEQRTAESRLPRQGESLRNGLLSFEQEDLGGEVQLQRYLRGAGEHLVTYGVSFLQSDFDQLRDRSEQLVATGEEVPTSLIFPTKYFPRSTVQELGVFLQDEIELFDGRLRLIPGVRYDRYDLDADGDDAIYISGNPGTEAPVDVEESSVSPKLGLLLSFTRELSLFGQYARGFRAPPYSAVNNGFTNFAGGYRTLPNPDLDPETSDNFELGLRGAFSKGSFSLVGFENRYDDFIDTVFLGFNPALFIVEFQPRNVDEVEIRGIELSSDLFFNRTWSLRGAFALIEGENVLTGEPLDSIAPDRFVVGLRFRPPGSRWRGELTTTYVASKDEDEVDRSSETFTQFRPPSATVVDLAGSVQITDQLGVTVGLYNLLGETYWNWGDVRGQNETSTTLDRFTRPGFHAGASVRYRF